MNLENRLQEIVAEFDTTFPMTTDRYDSRSEEIGFIRELFISSLRSLALESIEVVRVEKKEIRSEDLATGIGIDHLEYPGQEKSFNAAITEAEEKAREYTKAGKINE